jgi:hypothetical protein
MLIEKKPLQKRAKLETEDSSGFHNLMRFRNFPKLIKEMDRPTKTQLAGKISAKFKVVVNTMVIRNRNHIKAVNISNQQGSQTSGKGKFFFTNKTSVI